MKANRKQIKKRETGQISAQNELWRHLFNEHKLAMLETEIDEIILIAGRCQKKGGKR